MEAASRVKDPRQVADNFTLGERDSRSFSMKLCKKILQVCGRAQTFTLNLSRLALLVDDLSTYNRRTRRYQVELLLVRDPICCVSDIWFQMGLLLDQIYLVAYDPGYITFQMTLFDRSVR